MSVPPPVDESRVGKGEILAYGSGNFAEMMVFAPATTFVVFFYTDVAGIAAATVSTLLLISRAFDLLNPIAGILVDRTHNRFGKARPWLLWLAVPFGLCAVLLFSAPSLSPFGKVTYAFITYNLALTVLYPFIDVPFTALMSLITRDQHTRTTLNLSRMIQAQTGGLVSFAITLPLVKVFGGGAHGWQKAYIVFGTAATILLFICFLATKERVRPALAAISDTSFKDSASSLMRNRYWLLMGGIISVVFVMMGLYAANPYYCRYFLRDVDRFGPLMTAYQASLVAGMLAAGPIIKNLGKRKTGLLGVAVAVFGQLVMYLAPTSYAFVLAGTVIKALGISPLLGTLFAMVADSLEYGEWKFGIRAEGLAFGTIVLAAKMCIGLGNVLVGWLLGMAGYVNAAGIQAAPVLLAVKGLFLYLPLALLLTAGILLWTNKLEKQYSSIVAELTLRRDAAEHTRS